MELHLESSRRVISTAIDFLSDLAKKPWAIGHFFAPGFFSHLDGICRNYPRHYPV
jgi:hypothetical protein